MSWIISNWITRTVTAAALALSSWGSEAAESNPFASLADDFDSGSSDVEARGWSIHKPASATVSIVDGGLQIEPVQGGTGGTGSLWYTAGATQNDGILVYKTVGPGAGLPVGFDARARIVALNGALDNDPPDAGGDYRYAFLAVHDPDRSENLNYVHIAAGSGNGTAGIETKTTDATGGSGESVFPVTAQAGPQAWDLRIVRRTSNPQILDTYYRRTSLGHALTSNEDWTLHHTVDRSDEDSAEDTIPSRANAIELPETVQLGVGAYANPVADDIAARCLDFVVLPTTD